MPRKSREVRKREREKAERASSRGLPPPELDFGPRAASIPEGSPQRVQRPSESESGSRAGKTALKMGLFLLVFIGLLVWVAAERQRAVEAAEQGESR